MLLYKKIKKKRPAFMLVSALLATLILMMIAHGFMLMYGGQFTYLQAAKTASEGQQYAELVGEKVKLEGIDAEEVTSKTNLDTLTGNDKDKDWQYTYEISDGTEDDNGNIFKVATIKIYKDGENSPRYTYEVPLSSLGNNTDGLEIGMVVAWTLSVNPSDNYLECNGQIIDSSKYPKLYALMHNTPDYRGVFLRGLGGNSASLGELQGDAIRNITGKTYTTNVPTVAGFEYGTGAFYIFDLGGQSVDNSGSYYSYIGKGLAFDISRVVPTAEENRPVNKAVRYFIKAK